MGDNGQPEADFPDQPAFYRGVLDRCPTPVVVVDGGGVIVYANEALMQLSGYQKVDGVRTNIFEYLHPDDADWLAEAFAQLAAQDAGQAGWEGRPWSPIHTRLIASDGTVVPVEVRGRDATDEPDVAGVVYEVRPAHEREIFQRVLTGVAAGGDGETRIDLVMELVASSPLEISAAILELSGGGGAEVVAATSEELAAMLGRGTRAELGALTLPADEPTFVPVAEVAGALGDELAAAGLVDAWHTDVASPAPRSQHRLLAFTPMHHVPAVGVIDTLRRAAELAAVVLLRTRTEQLLQHAARHDELTELPNRRGLLDGARTAAADQLAVLFVDLDGFKSVNDRFGHAIGDVVLRELAERIKSVTRPSDLVARLGGDEFAVVISSPTRAELETAVPSLADRIIDVVDRPVETDRGTAALSASVGYVIVDAAFGLEPALASADRAMYAAKRAGGARAYDGTAEATS